MLAATDFSPASVRAIRCAHQLALRQLIVSHAPDCLRESGCAHCQEKLRFLAPFNESHTVPVEHIVAAGDAAERIVEYARKFAVDLVVLGSPEAELTEEELYTSTVLQAIANIGRPVLADPAGPYFRRIEDGRLRSQAVFRSNWLSIQRVASCSRRSRRMRLACISTKAKGHPAY